MATLTKPKRSADQVRQSNSESLKKADAVRRSLGKYKSKAASGVIDDSESFSIEAFCERLGCTRSAVTEMRKRGLIVRANGGKRTISGRDYNAYIQTLPPAELHS